MNPFAVDEIFKFLKIWLVDGNDKKCFLTLIKEYTKESKINISGTFKQLFEKFKNDCTYHHKIGLEHEIEIFKSIDDAIAP